MARRTAMHACSAAGRRAEASFDPPIRRRLREPGDGEAGARGRSVLPGAGSW